MKLILALPVVVASVLLLSGCTMWRVTGETVVGGPAGYGNPENLQNPYSGGTASPREIPSQGVKTER